MSISPTGDWLHVLLEGDTDSQLDRDLVDVGPAASVTRNRDTRILATYQLTDDGPKAHHARDDRPGRILRLSASHDGQFVAIVSPWGFPQRSGQTDEDTTGRFIPCYLAKDVTKIQTHYDLQQQPPLDVAFHPSGRFAVACNANEVFTFDLKSGRRLEGIVQLDNRKIQHIRRLWFSASGRHLLIDHSDEHARRIVQAFAITD